MNKLKENLKELRLHEGKLQREVADYLGIRHQSYQEYESGKSEPDIDKLIMLADYFDVTIDELVGRDLFK